MPPPLATAYCRKLKQCILRAHTEQIRLLKDGNELIQQICESVETVLQLGLGRQGFSAQSNQNYWQWMQSLVQVCEEYTLFVPPRYETAVKLIQDTSAVKSAQGRGRLLLRHLLHYQILDFPFKMLQDHRSLAVCFYDPDESVLGNEINVQIFTSLVSEVCRLNFQLDLDNAEFLDKSWQLPRFRRHEFVPCSALGLVVHSTEGHILVMKVNAAGVAGEDNIVEVGDIIASMYDKPLRYCQLQISSLMSLYIGQPVPMGIIKATLDDGTIYPHLQTLLRKHQLEHLISGTKVNKFNGSSHDKSQDDDQGTIGVAYVGQCDVGADGGVHMIDHAISYVLQLSSNSDDHVPVRLEFGEMGVTVWPIKADTGNEDRSRGPLLRHCFPQISSCGRCQHDSTILAYIVGDQSCSSAKTFVCHVFNASSVRVAKAVINALAQGFDRTHWTL